MINDDVWLAIHKAMSLSTITLPSFSYVLVGATMQWRSIHDKQEGCAGQLISANDLPFICLFHLWDQELIGCVNWTVTRVDGGSKNVTNMCDIIYGWSLSSIHIHSPLTSDSIRSNAK